jgi:rhamnogalacturonan endolyase
MGLALLTGTGAAATPKWVERLDRGVVAVPAKAGGVLISWRLLADDPAKAAFNIYRGGKRLNAKPLKGATNYVDLQPGEGGYTVRLAAAGPAKDDDRPATVWGDGYLSLPIQPPPDGLTPSGESYSYSANDASVGDLDGDGRYEIILKWDPSNSKDNAFGGYAGEVFLDAYSLDGQRLWRIGLGPNIRAGAHYTQFQVYDYDGDSFAELAVRTSDGTVDGTGAVLGDPRADWRESEGERPQTDRTGAEVKPDGSRVARVRGRILSGPEFLTIFDGRTGKALASAPFSPARDPRTDTPTAAQMTETWGDGYGNRSDRFLAGTAYLDGQRPSIVMGRGYYARSTVAAWDYRNGTLVQRWLFDSSQPGNELFAGQGNHQLSVADVDSDGRDEIIYGSMAIDDNGKGLWSARLFHGDAMHVGDLDPKHPGLEKFGVHESPKANGGIGTAMLDARTGRVMWTTPSETDTGRGLAADIDPRHPGAETWGTNQNGLFTVRGQPIAGASRPRQANFAIWWDGDELRELLDRNQISKWDWESGQATPLLTAVGVASNNGTKATPVLSADILGDWREEVIWRSEDNRTLRIYATPYLTERRLTTLMHDPQYRVSVAWQNTAYNQPPHVGFHLGAGMKTQRPAAVTPRKATR